MQLVYTGKSMYMNYETEKMDKKFGKDVVYRFLNSMHINWQAFLLQLSGTIINKHSVNLTSEERINAIIVDDSFYGRLRSKKLNCLLMYSIMRAKRESTKEDLDCLLWAGLMVIHFHLLRLIYKVPKRKKKDIVK